MESDLQHPQQQMGSSSGLMRYRSAPSSYFTNIVDREFCQQFFNRPSSPETERIFARFMNSDGGGGGVGDEDVGLADTTAQKLSSENTQFVTPATMSNEPAGGVLPPQPPPQQPTNLNSYSSASPSFYQSQSKPPLPTQNMASSNEGSSYVNQFPTTRTGGVNNSNLIRHSSSPAGLFASINIESLTAMRGMGSYGATTSTNEDTTFSSLNKLKNFSSGAGLMSPLDEIIDDKTLVAAIQDSSTEAFGEGHSNSNFVPNFPLGSWDDSALISDNISGLKRLRDEDEKPFSGLNKSLSETQSVEAGTRPPTMLAHHLSLPKTSSEMAAIEKFLQFQDSVPCKIRAKRGCATHPRSIAERVRRTKISERMRKLQELVPNMEKQTNTADMLDLAVEYIKDLQSQVQTLSDDRAKCTCSNKHQQ
ncbi:hypothetical protein CsatA_007285 [Cannabis sativa]